MQIFSAKTVYKFTKLKPPFGIPFVPPSSTGVTPNPFCSAVMFPVPGNIIYSR
nr:unnamed protein product [Callosobruchus analis]